jgi:hypothetical protein
MNRPIKHEVNTADVGKQVRWIDRPEFKGVFIKDTARLTPEEDAALRGILNVDGFVRFVGQLVLEVETA